MVGIATMTANYGGGALRPALACSLAPATFEEQVREASFIVVAEVVDVGGAANEQPPLPSATATITMTPLPSSTPEFTPTRTPRNFDSPTPEDTELAEPSATPAPPEDLTGYRAVLDPRVVYAGDSDANITVDALARRLYEEELRRREALIGPISSCTASAPFRYEVGREYFVMGRIDERGAHTAFVVPVQDNAVVFPEGSGLYMERVTHRRYFSEFQLVEGSGDDVNVGVRMGRMSLARFGSIVLAIRSGILPPETGNAGLAAHR
jgi:hypothetical protein